MANAANQKRGTTSEAVRKYFKKHRRESVQEAIDGLKAQGVEASKALVSKIKYSDRKAGGVKRGGKRKATAARRASAGSTGTASGETKADAIRDAFAVLGRRSRPRDVIAHLGEKGIIVSSSQVIGVRKAMKRRKPKSVEPEAATSKPAAAPEPTNGAIRFEHLIEAKKLADMLGGVEAARGALAALEKLI